MISSAEAVPDGNRRALARSARVVAIGVFLATAIVAARYVGRTSLVLDNERVYTLWDDAMISMRYAHNLARGEGLVWNPGDRIQGFTNLGLTLVMAVCHLVPLGIAKIPLIFQLVNLAFAGLAVAFAAKLTTRLTGEQGAGLVSALVVCLYAPLGIWAAQGADTAALALATLATIYYSLRTTDVGSVDRRAYLAGALGIGVRLDFALLYALILAFTFVRSGDKWRVLVWGGASLVGTLAVILLWGKLYYGDFLPNTFYLKATGIPRDQMIDSGFRQLKDHVSGAMLAAVVLAAAYAPFLIRRERAFALLYLIAGACAVYFVRVGGDWVVLHLSRYLVPAVPLLIVVLVGGAWHVAPMVGLHNAKLRGVLLALQVPLLALLLNRAPSLREWWTDQTPMYHADNLLNLRYARYFSRNTRSDATFGVFWAGVLPYYCERVAFDLLGRTDRHIAKMPAVPAQYYWPGHAKRDWSYVIHELRPSILMGEMDEMKARPDYRASYCRADSRELRFLARGDGKAKYLEPALPLCSVDSPLDRCLPCPAGAH